MLGFRHGHRKPGCRAAAVGGAWGAGSVSSARGKFGKNRLEKIIALSKSNIYKSANSAAAAGAAGLNGCALVGRLVAAASKTTAVEPMIRAWCLIEDDNHFRLKGQSKWSSA
jgi:hypothetical protein